MHATAALEERVATEKPILVSASPDISSTSPVQPKAGAKPGPKPGSRAKKASEGLVRYFLAGDLGNDGASLLGEELTSERDALIHAFRSSEPVFYAVTAYRAEIEDGEDGPRIVKRPAAS